MIVMGAKGHAKEVLQILFRQEKLDGLYFFDDVSKDLESTLFGRFPVLSDIEALKQAYRNDPAFVIATGNPRVRKKLCEKAISAGGKLESVISETANIGEFEVNLGNGLNIMDGVFIGNSTTIGTGSLINLNASVHHDASVGAFCEISPAAQILGGASIGDFSMVGAGAIVLPGVKVGNHSTIGAGAVIVDDLPEGAVAVGVPGKMIKVRNI